MPFGYGLWMWFKSNPAAQWAAGIVAAYLAFRLWLSSKVKRERREAAEEAREEVIEQIQEKTDEALQRVEDDRRATADLNDAQLRELARNSPHNRRRMPDVPPD